MNIEIAYPRRRADRRGHAEVGQGGNVRLDEAELRRLGAACSDALELVRTPDGIALLSPDVCPSKVYVELTTECNMDCAMCIRHTWDEPDGRMAPRTFRRIIEQLGELPGVSTIQLSGFGEPMVHPGFWACVALAKGAGYDVEVVTNGLLLEREAAQRLIDLRVDKLVVSVDGLDAARRRHLHAGAFAETYRRLRQLYLLRTDHKAARPEVGLEFVATRRNIAELPALRRLAPQLGFTSILVTNLVAYTAALNAETLYERWTTAPRQQCASSWSPSVDMPYTDARSEASAVMQRLRDSAARLRLNGVDLAGAGPRCRFVAEGRFAVTWDGSVCPCLPLTYSHSYYFRGQHRHVRCYRLGNVNDTPLCDIWDSDAYRAFRRRVREWAFAPCIDCGGCDLRETNEEDCFGDEFPRCGECLWAAGLVQCP